MVAAIAAVFAALTLATMGAVTGLFFAFSVAVMPGLDAIPADQASRAMQSMNRKILSPFFYATFLGAPIAGVITGVLLLIDGHTAGGVLFLAAAAAYFVGSIMVTGAVNVPMNNKLDAAEIPADTSAAEELWKGYSPRWTQWNTLRGLLCAISLLLAALATYVWGTNA